MRTTDSLLHPPASNDSFSQLKRLGWSSYFQDQLNRDNVFPPARIIGVRKNSFLVHDGLHEFPATLAGALLHAPDLCYPAVGDWVLLRDSAIVSILTRVNGLSRKSAGARSRRNADALSAEQMIAANLDTVFIVCGLDRDFNLRRLERYLTMVYNCGISPEIALSKADLHHDPDSCGEHVESIAFGVPVHLLSAGDDSVITKLRSDIREGRTIALIGSSGAGKSTLINRLYGEEIRMTGTVSEQLGKGKHTTTNRELILLPSGGMVIDNPGLREISLSTGRGNAPTAFPEIEKLAHLCRFQDCTHTHEPGCEVQNAVSDGRIPAERLQSYRKIQGELDYLSLREDKSAARVEKERWKGVSQKIKNIKRGKQRH